MAFGDNLKKIREEQSYETAEIAKYLGVRRETVWRWEENKSKPRARQIRMLAKLFKVDVERLTS
jgi:transcriptional regulator with XRE-family HTH domain